MPAQSSDTRRNSSFLELQKFDYSLTLGTNIPAPFESPPTSPVENGSISKPRQSRSHTLSRPPTSGGPLTSHPTYNDPMSKPGTFPPTPDPEIESRTQAYNHTMSSESNRDTSDSLQTPTSPRSVGNNMQSTPEYRRPSAVRRLLSLTSLRKSSFSSSRSTYSVRPPGSSYGETSSQWPPRAQTPSIMSTNGSMAAPSSFSTQQDKLRAKRSSNWFKRKSGFFNLSENGVLDVVSEDPRPDSKRAKHSPGLPMLPEISTLSGGTLGDGEGSIGWDEQLFKR